MIENKTDIRIAKEAEAIEIANLIYDKIVNDVSKDCCDHDSILENTGLIIAPVDSLARKHLVPVTSDLTDECLQDLCDLLQDILEDFPLNSGDLYQGMSKLRMYGSPTLFEDMVPDYIDNSVHLKKRCFQENQYFSLLDRAQEVDYGPVIPKYLLYAYKGDGEKVTKKSAALSQLESFFINPILQ